MHSKYTKNVITIMDSIKLGNTPRYYTFTTIKRDSMIVFIDSLIIQ